MPDLKTRHIWMPDYRSLCYRRLRLRVPKSLEGATDAEFAAEMDIQLSAPSCGACIVVAAHIRQRAAGLVAVADYNGLGILPAIPAKAFRALGETPWFHELDSEPANGLDHPAYYRRSVTELLDDDWLRAAADRATAENARWRADMEKRWRPQRT